MKTKSLDEHLKGGLIQESQSQYLEAVGWYRIAVAESDNPPTLDYGKNLMISLIRTYGSTNNEAYLISFTGAYRKPQFKILNSAVNLKIFDKIRCTLRENSMYIEVYYNGSGRNGMMVGIYGQTRFKSSDPTFITLPFETADDTATVLAEQEI